MNGEVGAFDRIEGGTRVGGSEAGMSLPDSLPWMRCIATANPSRVKRPSLFTARSLVEGIRLCRESRRGMNAPNFSEDLLRQVGLQHEGNCNIAFDISSFV